MVEIFMGSLHKILVEKCNSKQSLARPRDRKKEILKWFLEKAIAVMWIILVSPELCCDCVESLCSDT
jgi:hypothetical protein